MLSVAMQSSSTPLLGLPSDPPQRFRKRVSGDFGERSLITLAQVEVQMDEDEEKSLLQSPMPKGRAWHRHRKLRISAAIVIFTLTGILLIPFVLAARKGTHSLFLPALPFKGRFHLPSFLTKALTTFSTETPQSGAEEPMYVNTFQDRLPRRTDYGRPVDEWTAAELDDARRGVDKLRRIMPKRWSAGPTGGIKSYRVETVAALDRLSECLWNSTCTTGQTEVVLAGSFHFGASQVGFVSGEDIWARSSIDAFKSLGYTILYAWDVLESLDLYLAIPDLIKVVILEHGRLEECLERGISGYERPLNENLMKDGAKVTKVKVKTEHGKDVETIEVTSLIEAQQVMSLKMAEGYSVTPMGFKKVYGQIHSWSPHNLDKSHPDYEPHDEWRCIKSPGFEEGIPVWKIFAWHFWDTSVATLGHLWTLAPEDYQAYPGQTNKDKPWNVNFFLGYSMENYVSEPIPMSEREHRAYILAKHPNYWNRPQYKLDYGAFERLNTSTDMEFMAGAGKPGTSLPDAGINNVGQMSSKEFNRALGHSKALIGIGKPVNSPTPYEALCMGVPFINPVSAWNKDDPTDKTKWKYQHEGLADIQAPYVYHVFANNETGLAEALVSASENQIGRFVPPKMSLDAVKKRHETLVSVDWKILGGMRMSQILQEGNTVTFSI